MREKYYYLAGGWRLELGRCERNTVGLELEAGAEHATKATFHFCIPNLCLVSPDVTQQQALACNTDMRHL